jgi:hypothetical protein
MKFTIRVQRYYHVEYGRKVLRWLEQFKEIGSVLHKMDTGKSSVDTETAESFQPIVWLSIFCVGKEFQILLTAMDKILSSYLKQ